MIFRLWTLEIERAITSDIALTKYAGSAGAITDTANRERQIQFALRLEF